MKMLHTVAFILLIVGGLNWGLSAFGYNVVDMLLGAGSQVAMIVYVLVGAAALFEALTHKSYCKHCDTGKMAGQM